LKLRIWLKVPSVGEIDLVSIGGDGSFQVPANFDTNLGPLTLFTVSSSLPRGNWEWNSRVTDPTTSALLNEDFNPFVIQ